MKIDKTSSAALEHMNSDDHDEFAPIDLYGYARQSAMQTLILNWTECPGEDVADLANDIDEVIEELREFKRAVLAMATAQATP
jgi:hypothetical protein